MFCGHGNHSASHARPPSSLTAEDAASVCGMLCIHSGGFSRSQSNDAAPAARATYFRTAVRCLLNVLRHGNSSAFCAPPSSLTAEDVASVRGILCIHAGGFSLMLTSDAALLSALHIFVQLYTRDFKMFCGHGNHSASHVRPPSSLTA